MSRFTWLTRSVYNNEILPANITIYLRDRCTRGGGVLIVVSNAISSRLVHSSDTVELIASCFKLVLVPKVFIVYIPSAIALINTYYMFSILLILCALIVI